MLICQGVFTFDRMTPASPGNQTVEVPQHELSRKVQALRFCSPCGKNRCLVLCAAQHGQVPFKIPSLVANVISEPAMR